jgi:hypothetical protein
MHRCEIRLLPKEKMEEGTCYDAYNFYPGDEEINSHPPTWVEATSYPTCDAPATKQHGQIWMCDFHWEWYEENFDVEEEDDPVPILILEGRNFCEDDEEDSET